MSENKQRKVWLIWVKRVVWGILLAALIGLGLYFTAKFNTYSPPASGGLGDWGISKDSPLRINR